MIALPFVLSCCIQRRSKSARLKGNGQCLRITQSQFPMSDTADALIGPRQLHKDAAARVTVQDERASR
jgi:hypothetical protein